MTGDVDESAGVNRPGERGEEAQAALDGTEARAGVGVDMPARRPLHRRYDEANERHKREQEGRGANRAEVRVQAQPSTAPQRPATRGAKRVAGR